MKGGYRLFFDWYVQTDQAFEVYCSMKVIFCHQTARKARMHPLPVPNWYGPVRVNGIKNYISFKMQTTLLKFASYYLVLSFIYNVLAFRRHVSAYDFTVSSMWNSINTTPNPLFLLYLILLSRLNSGWTLYLGHKMSDIW